MRAHVEFKLSQRTTGPRLSSTGQVPEAEVSITSPGTGGSCDAFEQAISANNIVARLGSSSASAAIDCVPRDSSHGSKFCVIPNRLLRCRSQHRRRMLALESAEVRWLSRLVRTARRARSGYPSTGAGERERSRRERPAWRHDSAWEQTLPRHLESLAYAVRHWRGPRCWCAVQGRALAGTPAPLELAWARSHAAFVSWCTEVHMPQPPACRNVV